MSSKYLVFSAPLEISIYNTLSIMEDDGFSPFFLYTRITQTGRL